MDLLVPSFGLIFWTLLCFLIFFYILKKFAWKPILSSLKERETGIAGSLESAEKVRAEMALMKSENEALLAQAREERAKMIKEAKDTSDKMISDARDKARIEFERIVADAQGAIHQQTNAALVEVKNQMGRLVIEVSEKVLRRELANPMEQEKYINQLAETVKLN